MKEMGEEELLQPPPPAPPGAGGEGSPLVQAEDVRVTDSSRHLSEGGALASFWTRPLLPPGVLGRGLLGFAVGEGRWVGRVAGRADPTCGGP